MFVYISSGWDWHLWRPMCVNMCRGLYCWNWEIKRASESVLQTFNWRSTRSAKVILYLMRCWGYFLQIMQGQPFTALLQCRLVHVAESWPLMTEMFLNRFKGIVHLKIKIPLFQICMTSFLPWNTQKIFGKSTFAPTDFHCMGNKTFFRQEDE